MLYLTALLGLTSVSVPWHVQGNQIVDDSGKVVHIRGINICSLEWTDQGDHVLDSVHVALDEWHANTIRLPLCQDRWLGGTSNDSGQAYRALVKRVVEEVGKRGDHVLLDLHWSDCDVMGQNIGQHKLPDDISLQFWKSCAATFKNDPAVFFDLYNEPIDAPWDVWRNGRDITETVNGKQLSYHAVGMQQLLDAIRAAGAKNLVLAGGLGYASRFDGLDTHLLDDPDGNGVAYSDHFYPEWSLASNWEPFITDFAAHHPVVVGEFGSDPGSQPMDDPKRRVAQVLHILHRHDLNWIAWCMHPQASPCLIQDWSYKPTPYFGTLVKEALAGNWPEVPPQRTTSDDKVVYHDGLQNNWQTWGVGDFASTGATHSGTKSIKAELQSGQMVDLGSPPFNTTPYDAVSLWINGGDSGDQQLKITPQVGETAGTSVPLGALAKNAWLRVVIPFDRLGIVGIENLKGFQIRTVDGGPCAPFYIDDVTVLGRH